MKWVILAFAMMWMGSMMKWLFSDGDSSSKRLSGKHGRRAAAELEAALEQRDLVIEDLQRRIGELESRLDFTERLLTEKRDAAAI